MKNFEFSRTQFCSPHSYLTNQMGRSGLKIDTPKPLYRNDQEISFKDNP